MNCDPWYQQDANSGVLGDSRLCGAHLVCLQSFQYTDGVQQHGHVELDIRKPF